MLQTALQIFQGLKRQEDGGAAIFADDPELHFAPYIIKFLRDRGVTGKEPDPFKPITVAQLVDIRKAANQLAME